MKKTTTVALALLLAGAAAAPAATNYRKLALKRRFLGSVWRNISRLNSDNSRFGSRGERTTAGVRGQKSTNVGTPGPAPTKQGILKRIALMEKMLFKEKISKAERIRALYYLGACHLYLGQLARAQFYFDRLYRYAPDNRLTGQLRRDIAVATGK